MRTLLFVLGGKTTDNKPDKHFLLRTQAAIEYYNQHHLEEDIVFMVSGRWTNVTDNFQMTEAEVGKMFILDKIPTAIVYKEDISVELIGNYAFSKPIISALNPSKVIIFTSELLLARNSVIAQRIFDDDISHNLMVITNDLSDNAILVDKEKQATKLFSNLFDGVVDGDDSAFRNRLLYSTPYYFKGMIEDKDFFDSYWDGGFEHYLNALAVRNTA